MKRERCPRCNLQVFDDGKCPVCSATIPDEPAQIPLRDGFVLSVPRSMLPLSEETMMILDDIVTMMIEKTMPPDREST